MKAPSKAFLLFLLLPDWLKLNHFKSRMESDFSDIFRTIFAETIDEYSMMSHCHGTQKLESNGGVMAQLQVITLITSVKEPLLYN